MTNLFGDIVKVADVLAAGFQQLTENTADKFSPQPGLMFIVANSQSADDQSLYICYLLEVIASAENKVTLKLIDTHGFVEVFAYSFQQLKDRIILGLRDVLSYQTTGGGSMGPLVGKVYFKPPETVS